MNSIRSVAGSCAFHAAIAVLLLTACKEATAPGPRGSLRVSVAAVGGDIDESYEITLGAETRVFGSAGVSSTTLTDIEPGTHSVELKQVAANCVIDGDNPRSIDVRGQSLAEVTFVVRCDATGVSITTVTSGPDRPFLGYELKSGSRTELAPAIGNVVMSRLPVGRHTISFSNIADECAVDGGNAVTADVLNRRLTEITVRIECVRSDNRIAYVDQRLSGQIPTQWIVVAAANGRGVPVFFARGRDPAWSRGRSMLAGSNTQCDYYQGCTGGIVMIDARTGVESMPAYGNAGIQPEWSLDGKYLVFVRQWVNSPKLVIAESNGAAVELEIPGVVDAWSPSWSPDGRRLVFQCGILSDKYDICIVERDGTGLRLLTNDLAYDYSPQWSPDGARIVFTTFDPNAGMRIKSMTLDGTNVTQIALGDDPQWSPDGSKVIFSRYEGLFTVDASGSNVKKITTGTHSAPTWLR